MEECSEASLYSNEEDVICPGPLFRVKLFVLGDVGCGKTSLVQSLIGPAPKTTDHSTEGVSVELWYPFKTSSVNEALLGRKLSGEEHHLIIEIWDLAGRQVCQSAHQVYMTPESIFLLVYNSVDPTSCDSVVPIFDMVQQKAPGCTIILVGTKSDKSRLDGNKTVLASAEEMLYQLKKSCDAWKQAIKQEIEELRSLGREMRAKQPESANKSKQKNDSKPKTEEMDTAIKHQLELLEASLDKCPKLPDKVYSVSSSDGKGLNDLKKVLLKTALDRVLFPHQDRTIKQGTIALYDEILKLREKDTFLLSWRQYKDMATKNNAIGSDSTLEEETAFLQTVGGVLDFKLDYTTCMSSGKVSSTASEDDSRIVCVYPSVLANAVCSCLVDDDKKAFHFEAGRFWPKDSGFKRPDPHSLGKLLENIPHHGLIRESLFPLLWQDYFFSEEQILYMIKVFSSLGVLMPYSTCRANCEGLALPFFPGLSVQKCHYVALLDLLPDNKPQLNWTPKPFKGDLQISWQYVFPQGLPLSVAKRVLGHSQFVGSDFNMYCYIWKYGILLRIGEATVCIEHGDTHIIISCRVNADDPGKEDAAVQLLWVSFAPFLLSTQILLQSWPGIIHKVSLIPIGHQFYKDEKVEMEPAVSMLQSLTYWQANRKYTFKDGEVERELDLDLLFPFKAVNKTFSSTTDWLWFLLDKKDEMLASEDLENQKKPQAVNLFPHRQGSLRLKNKKKKNVEVKWKPEEKVTDDKSKKLTQISSVNTDITVKNKEMENGKAQEKISEISQDKTSSKFVDNDGTENALQSSVSMVGNVDLDDRVMRIISDEEEMKEVTRIASGFVAAVMATAVADFISAECANNHSYREVVCVAQVAAAKVTAEAARAAQTGDINGAAKAVLDAVKAVEAAMEGNSSVNRQSPIRSRMCTIV